MRFRLFADTPTDAAAIPVAAVLSRALGLGANAAIFSLFDQLLLRSLPVPEPERLVNLGAPGPKPGSQSCNNAGDCDEVFSFPMFRDLEREQTVFTGIAAHRTFGANLAFEGQTSSSQGMLVSGSYFPTLGLRPALGRLLDPGDDRVVGESRVVVLSYDAWRNRFGEDPGLLNETLVVNGQPLTVVGVAPEGFRGTTLGSRPEVFVPITLRGLMAPGFDGFDNRLNYWAYLFARLRPGVSLEGAKTALNGPYHAIVNEVEEPLQHGLSESRMKEFREKEVTVEPGWRGQSSIHREARTPLLLLFAVAGVVLLIACANIANLLLARSATRAGEMAVRLSVGASRGKLITQLLSEACLLALFGAVAGIAVARGTLVLIGSLLPPEAAQTLELTLNLHVVVFAAVLALGTGLLFGLFPALHSTRPDLASMLKGQSGQPSGSRGAARFRASLVTAQIALSMALLVSAGLFIKSLVNVSRIDLGLEVDHLVTFAISPELNGYEPEQSRNLFVRAEEELAALPGVSAVTASLVPLLAGTGATAVVAADWADGMSASLKAGLTAALGTDTEAVVVTLVDLRLSMKQFRSAAKSFHVFVDLLPPVVGIGGVAVGTAYPAARDTQPVRDPAQQIVGVHLAAADDLRDLGPLLAGQLGNTALLHTSGSQQPVHRRDVAFGQRPAQRRVAPNRRVDHAAPPKRRK